MKWTHFYDFFMKLISMIIAIIITLLATDTSDSGIVIFLVVFTVYLFTYFFVFRTLGSYLYCRYTLKMNITFAQAKKLNDALSPVFSIKMNWLPLTEVKNLDASEKYEAALSIHQQWKEANQKTVSQEKEKFKSSSLQTKALTVIMLLLCCYFLVAGFLNLPPSNYLTMVYCKIFATDSYFPILNASILILITIIVFKKIDKNIS